MAGRLKKQKSRYGKDLPSKIEIAKGMKVLVTNNLETDLDITNGAKGEIVDIVLHPDEPINDHSKPIVHLQYLPLYILVKLDRTRASKLAGLEEGVIPIEPVSSTMKIIMRTAAGKVVHRTVKRRQFPMCAAYGFTDYRAQGQTVPYILIDIKTPPTGGLSLYNLYVSLSRSSGRDTIRLLRDFDDNIFMQAHDPELLLEDAHLEQLSKDTVHWWERINTVIV
ncbi:MAG TPA: hypothetical protein VGO47_11520 [Chlamydiales bacterium]|nr:hypothetical protein [Chlamydiales bacterium]